MAHFVLNLGLEFWNVLTEMAPFLLFGFLVAGLLSVLIRPETVERHLGGRGLWPVVKAAAFGVPLPLCSCGVIPVAASLRRHGANRGATTSFLLSTPQTSVDSILVTLSLLGPVFAVFRPVAALVVGIAGGALITLTEGTSGDTEEATAPCTEACCAGSPHGNWLARALRYGFVTLPRDIARPLLIGLAIAGLVSVLVPDDFFAEVLGRGILAKLAMMALGIPIYVCATSSVPIAATLIAKGITPGAALVFLMTGPATNAATVATIWKFMGRRSAVIYLCTVAVCALAAGMLLDGIYSMGDFAVTAGPTRMIPPVLRYASGLVLLAVVARAMFARHPRHAGEPAESVAPRSARLRIVGMTCQHCADSIRRALRKSPGVQWAEVDLKTGQAMVRGEEFDVPALRQSIEELGYAVQEAQEDVPGRAFGSA